jgi:hypothetical protein
MRMKSLVAVLLVAVLLVPGCAPQQSDKRTPAW